LDKVPGLVLDSLNYMDLGAESGRVSSQGHRQQRGVITAFWNMMLFGWLVAFLNLNHRVGGQKIMPREDDSPVPTNQWWAGGGLGVFPAGGVRLGSI
jgi:hypothetical protein